MALPAPAPFAPPVARTGRRALARPVFVFLFAIVTAFFGAIAPTADLVLAGLSAGALFGSPLFACPVWKILAVLGLGPLLAGVIPIFTAGLASSAVWGVPILGFVVFLQVLFVVATHPRSVRGMPFLVWLGYVPTRRPSGPRCRYLLPISSTAARCALIEAVIFQIAPYVLLGHAAGLARREAHPQA
ncbi:MAG: hypothetical protein M5U08_02360 [Burkholderiales bacterium]|nr:hypothetical protein [Burkholderiales bacterium]